MQNVYSCSEKEDIHGKPSMCMGIWKLKGFFFYSNPSLTTFGVVCFRLNNSLLLWAVLCTTGCFPPSLISTY